MNVCVIINGCNFSLSVRRYQPGLQTPEDATRSENLDKVVPPATKESFEPDSRKWSVVIDMSCLVPCTSLVGLSCLYIIKSRPWKPWLGLYTLLLLYNIFGFHKLCLVFSYVLNGIKLLCNCTGHEWITRCSDWNMQHPILHSVDIGR